MKALADLLKNVETLSLPDSWEANLARIAAERRYLDEIVAKGEVGIYGVNTLTGHRDGERLGVEAITRYQQDLLESHAIDVGADFYDAHAARCIGYAKLYAFSAGMSGVSTALFQLIGPLAANPDFQPRDPRNCSYSSGDVIPAAHWARAALAQLARDHGYIAQPGEAMALINGNFIQTGYAASLCKNLKTAWLFFLELCAVSNTASRANSANLHHIVTPQRPLASAAIDYVRSRSRAIDKDIQDPVSVRAVPQVIDLLALAIEEFLQELDTLLQAPSGNPLYSPCEPRPLSQASFLAATLTARASTLIDALLFAMWAMVGRTTHVLSGAVEGIPRDAANPSSSLGLIQYPKLMMSILERARMDNGRRPYSAGASTSYGTEDLWNHGLSVLGQLENLLQDFLLANACERFVFSYLDKHLELGLAEDHELVRRVPDGTSLKASIPMINAHIENSGLGARVGLFPV